MKPYILGAIFARGGSKGIAQKNIKMFAGKPLLAHAIELGQSLSVLDRLIVSTDSDDIASVAREYGADVPFVRPDELATDTAPEILAWKHAIEQNAQQTGKKVDVLVVIPTTSPLRSVADVALCIDTLCTSKVDIVVTVKHASRNPYFNMVKHDAFGYVTRVIDSQESFFQRQKAPVVYDMTTVAYVARADYVLSASSVLDGMVKAVVIPEERALDIDTMFDFEVAEFLMLKQKGQHAGTRAYQLTR